MAMLPSAAGTNYAPNYARVCKYFLQGLCKFGEHCRYSHNMFEQVVNMFTPGQDNIPPYNAQYYQAMQQQQEAAAKAAAEIAQKISQKAMQGPQDQEPVDFPDLPQVGSEAQFLHLENSLDCASGVYKEINSKIIANYKSSGVLFYARVKSGPKQGTYLLFCHTNEDLWQPFGGNTTKIYDLDSPVLTALRECDTQSGQIFQAPELENIYDKMKETPHLLYSSDEKAALFLVEIEFNEALSDIETIFDSTAPSVNRLIKKEIQVIEKKKQIEKEKQLKLQKEKELEKEKEREKEKEDKRDKKEKSSKYSKRDKKYSKSSHSSSRRSSRDRHSRRDRRHRSRDRSRSRSPSDDSYERKERRHEEKKEEKKEEIPKLEEKETEYVPFNVENTPENSVRWIDFRYLAQAIIWRQKLMEVPCDDSISFLEQQKHYVPNFDLLELQSIFYNMVTAIPEFLEIFSETSDSTETPTSSEQDLNATVE